VIVGRAACRFDEATRHIRIERVTAVRTVHGDGEQAAVEILQDDFVCAHGGWLSLFVIWLRLLSVIARSEATKQSILPLARWIASLRSQ
jgi:hypothetical protein